MWVSLWISQQNHVERHTGFRGLPAFPCPDYSGYAPALRKLVEPAGHKRRPAGYVLGRGGTAKGPAAAAAGPFGNELWS